MKHEICRIADIPEKGSLIAPFFGREVHVYRSGERIRAAANVCLHFGGPLGCKDGKLVPVARRLVRHGERWSPRRPGAEGLPPDVPLHPRRGRRIELCLGRVR
ncbi:Rieske 2Fe-2S domain-containing protein [Mesorhizobium sp. M0814]|uniref:Rieske (2Fe-2S) protein n=1 Tax=Mesorhizobium sp. M0814 TaxID=2957004 RepID=UPI003336928C